MRTLLFVLCAAMAAGQEQDYRNYTSPIINPKQDLCHDKDGKDICPPPRSVPAVRKTKIVHYKGECWGADVGPGVGGSLICAHKDVTEPYWTCDDPSIPGGADRALLVSENQKKAMCLLVE